MVSVLNIQIADPSIVSTASRASGARRVGLRRGIMENEIVKTCLVCGATYTAKQWAELPRLGVQRFDHGPDLELKNCSGCTGPKGTLAMIYREPVAGEARYNEAREETAK